jgi:exopolyphosphatase / guanosine-5'-triphosphate,3'-diphosphate pyrophosphatase
MTHAEVVAAVDCGTNSTRLLIVDGAGRTEVREMIITRLGQGVDESRTLRPEAVARTLGVLTDFRELLDARGAGSARVVATSAVRDADNGEQFLRSVSSIIGVEAEVLLGDEEGRLSYLGATADLPGNGADPVVLDIGGGSTEIATARAGEISVVSMNLGCVRLTERCLLHDPPTAAEEAAAVEVIADELSRACLVAPVFEDLPSTRRLIGLAGTVSTLAALDLGLADYDRDAIHHSVLSFDAVARWCRDLGKETYGERAGRRGMSAGRHDVILGGALVLREVMRRFSFDDCLVSESDILDGLVLSQRSLPSTGS